MPKEAEFFIELEGLLKNFKGRPSVAILNDMAKLIDKHKKHLEIIEPTRHPNLELLFDPTRTIGEEQIQQAIEEMKVCNSSLVLRERALSSHTY